MGISVVVLSFRKLFFMKLSSEPLSQKTLTNIHLLPVETDFTQVCNKVVYPWNIFVEHGRNKSKNFYSLVFQIYLLKRNNSLWLLTLHFLQLSILDLQLGKKNDNACLFSLVCKAYVLLIILNNLILHDPRHYKISNHP